MVTLAIVVAFSGLLIWGLVTGRKQWAFSKGDPGWFVFTYVFCFLGFRFDMFSRHGPWFQDPMPTARAAWIALLVAVGVFFVVKIKRAGDAGRDE